MFLREKKNSTSVMHVEFETRSGDHGSSIALSLISMHMLRKNVSDFCVFSCYKGTVEIELHSIQNILILLLGKFNYLFFPVVLCSLFEFWLKSP